MQLTVYLPAFPQALQGAISTSRFAKDCTFAAIAAGLEPGFLSAGAQRVSLYLSAEEHATLAVAVTLRRQQGDATIDGRLFGQWCAAWLDHLGRRAAPPRTKATVLRPDQEVFCERLLAGMDAGKIVLCEGATGIGKGRVLARAALHMAQGGKGPVKVASPTLSVLRQNLREWFAIEPPAEISVAPVFGRSSFCNPDAVRAVVEDQETGLSEQEKAAVLAWLAGGGKPVPGSGTEDLALAAPVAYLLDDLYAVAPNAADWKGITLQAGESDGNPAEATYLALRWAATEADVTYTTHAMIAFDLHLTRKKIYAAHKEERGTLLKGEPLPKLEPDEYAILQAAYKEEDAVLIGAYRTLLVDEAHLFEQSVAAAETEALSIMALRARLRSMDYSTQAKRDKAMRICQALMASGEESPHSDLIVFPIDWTAPGRDEGRIPDYYRVFLSRLKELVQAIEAMKTNRGRRPPFLDEAMHALRRIVACKKPVRFDVTPVRRWPTITVGPVSVAGVLRDLWASVDAAALVSATLFLPGRFGGRNTGFVQQVLSIPPERVDSPEPVSPAWVTDRVVLHRPADDETILQRLIPPRELAFRQGDVADVAGFQAASGRWISEVSDWIGPIVQQATGGTLVLMTAYEWIERLEQHLLAWQGVPPERLIVQQRGQSFLMCRKCYQELADAGARPIWLATGPAWTGLDLSDHDRPGLLQNLVIPRLPFGAGQTMTSAARRRKKQGGHGDSRVNEAAFILRQGIGRLVRHPEARDKHLWILDGRIWLPRQKIGEAFFQVFRDILAVYRHVELLREPGENEPSPGVSRRRNVEGNRADLRRWHQNAAL